MNVPLDFRLLITLGSICSLRKEQQRTNILSNLYQFDELEFLSLSEQTYLQSGTLQCIYLYIHQDNGKLFIDLFIPNNCRVFIGILDSIRENHMPNLNKLLKNECEKRLQKSIDTNLLPINEHQFEVKVDTDIQNIWKRFNKIIANRNYKNKDTGQDIYIVANGSMLRECLTENINQLNVFVDPPTRVPLPSSSSSSSSSHSKSNESTELVQRWPELMKSIDHRINRWTSRSDE
ncbi:unnamed protein product [Rotaria sordida]|uniref:DNA polymerase epsilon catalytic subunit n=1 Tax=Rotaria sordida TaxID=392033 RepID=A0A819P656_9BILA|nr:unnamed protein product [Rotaria sordida]